MTLTHAFWLLGAMFASAAIMNLRERRWASAAFWAIVCVPFFAGDQMLAAAKAGTQWPLQAMGGGVIALALLAARNKAGAPADTSTLEQREASAARLRNLLFVPALAIPVLVAAIVLAAKPAGSPIPRWLDPAQLTLIALAIAAVLALALALAITRTRPPAALTEGRRLLDTIGWAAVMPIVLATLGSVFAATGVDKAIAAIVSAVIPTDSRLACVLAYGLGMVVFTAIMGNAFAAFPVMTAGVGLPLIVLKHGGDPAALGAIGMLTGYCGTLLTPMAANFNIVPAVLLELRDRYGVIRAQVPTALVLLAANLVLLYLLVFR